MYRFRVGQSSASITKRVNLKKSRSPLLSNSNSVRYERMAAQGTQGVPVLLLKEGTGRSAGTEAQRNHIAVAKGVAEPVRSALGPRGMAQRLVSSIGDGTITNDGATKMKEHDVQ